MSERMLSPAGYIIVLVILLLLTALTVGLSFLHDGGIAHLVIGESIAVGKAALVVLFFMHAFRSSAQTRAVIAVTVFWFVVVLLSLTMSDYFTRGMLPNVPGH